jgi:alpha-L-fucosidase
MIRNLIDIASKGGNYLLNIGPTGNGSVPRESVAAMQAIGGWMKNNGDAIYATSASPFAKLDWGRCTQKPLPGGKTRLYLHVFDWPKDGKLLVPLALSGSAHARSRAGGKTLAVAASGRQTSISVTPEAPDPIASVIELDIEGQPKVGELSNTSAGRWA